MTIWFLGGDPSIDWFGEMVSVALIIGIAAFLYVVDGPRWAWRLAALYFGLSAIDSILKLAGGGWSTFEWGYHAFWIVVGLIVIRGTIREEFHA